MMSLAPHRVRQTRRCAARGRPVRRIDQESRLVVTTLDVLNQRLRKETLRKEEDGMAELPVKTVAASRRVASARTPARFDCHSIR